MLTFYSCTYRIPRHFSTTTLPSQATRTKRFIMPIIIATLFLSFHSASAQSDNNVTNVQTCVSCPTGATCFTDEARNMTKEWGYNGYICSSSQECYGENSMNVQLPRQIPVVILLGDRLTFVPWREQDFEFQPYNLSKADFDKCNVVGTSLSPSLTGDPVVVEDRYLRPPGIKYFAVKTNNNLFTCDFGMKLEVSVRSKEPCINPNDRSTGVCSGKGQCVMLGQFFTYNMTCKCCDYYTGKYCEELNSCLRSPCQNQATCLDINAGLRDAYNCSCVPGFTGKNCEINIDDCASRPCLNGGLCVDGVNSYSCLCQPDINGNNCEIVTPNRCQPNPCENGGTCDRTVGNDGSRSNYSCTCVSGYTGRNCTERDLCEPENPCANGGTCQRTIGSDGSLGYNCTCAPGYLGTNCTERNLCEPVNPCINGGTCLRTVGSDGSPGYNCTCAPGYLGTNCTERNLCEPVNPCINGGTCLRTVGSDGSPGYNCTCAPGYLGTNCTERNLCEPVNPCINGGTCLRTVGSDGSPGYNCTCAPGYLGTNCTERNLCEPVNPCINGGTCLRTVGSDGSPGYNCTCAPGYLGTNCTERNLCEPVNPCINGGTCLRTVGSDGSLGYNCTCAPGYLGTNCTERNLCEPVNPCVNGGTCLRTVGSNGSPGYNCTCAPGYLGTNCTERNLCEPVNPCINGGTCLRTVGSDGSPGYNCTCAPGYLGTNCTERNLCEPVNPCANGGTCKRTVGSDGSAGYNCTCIEGFTGENCSEFTPSSSLVPSPSSSSDIQKTAIRSTSVTVQYSTSSVPIIAITTSYDMAETTSLVSTLQLLTTPAATLPTDSLKSTGVFKPTTAIDTQLSTITPTSPSSITSSDVGSTDTATSTPTSSPSSPITSSDVGGSDTTSSLIIIDTTTSGITPTSTISVTTLTTTRTHTTTSITLHPSSAILDNSLGPASTPRTTISSTTHVSSTPIASSSMVMTPTAINPSATVTTTVPSTSVVVKPVRDMTCSDSPCGPGTCIDVKDYHALVNFTCQCPYKTFGPRCSRDYTPHFIRFSNNSYLVHKEIVTSPEFNKIVIAFKTNATDGLLFFSKHASYRDFFQLHIVGGKLEFRFDPGDRLAAIKSDADVSIGRKITAVITYNSRTKTATLQVDSGDVYRKVLSGDLVGINLGDKWYIGGAPPSISLGSTVGAVVTPSLVGCISDIEVNNVGIKLTDATDWYNLGECDAPCVNNPCHNGGTCTPDGDDPHDYDCKCPSGYQGKSCTLISACVGDPCNGGRCIVSNSSQPQNHVCLCPYGKAGVSCEHDISISVPGFTMLHGYASYIQYATPTPGASHFDITMQFRVDDPIAWNDALLLYSSQDRYLGGGDFIALGLKDGQILLQYNLGSGLARIKSCSLNKTQDWHTVTAGRSGREGYVYADNCEKVRGSSEGNLQGLDLYAPLFIGGVHDLSELPTYVDFKSGFRGNLYGMAIRFSNQEVWRNLSLLQTQGVSERVEAGSNIGNESYNECISQTPPCLNGGNCTRHAATYVCRCLPGWRGLYCGSRSIPCLDYNPCAFGSTCREKQGVVTCDCPLGRTGLTCSQKLNIQVPLFKESSYMEFKSPAYIRTVTSIVIKFTPKALNGLLFYTTHKIDSLRGDFISLALHNGFIQGRFDLGSGIGFGQTTQPVTINTEVTVILNRTRNSGSLQLNNDPPVAFTSPGNAVALDVTSNLYLGGAPQLSSVNPRAVEDVISLRDYTGCISEAKVNNQALVLTEVGAVSGRNIDNCATQGAVA